MRPALVAVLSASVVLASCAGGSAARATPVRWSAVASVDDAAHASIARLTSGAPGVVAVGSVAGSGGSVAAVWTSGDSAHWRRVSDNGTVFPIGSAMRSVTTGAGGFAGVGTIGDRGAVWTSGDGLHWEQQASSEPSLAHAVVASVTGGVGPGYVAVGTKDGHGAAWYSSDGHTWHPATVPGAPTGSRLNQVVAAAPEVVAVGSDGQGGAVWESADGMHWNRRQPDGRPFPAGSELRAVQPTAPGLVVVGRTASGPAAWRTADGHRWSVTSLGGGDAEADALVVGAPGLVAVGGGSQGPQAWVSSDEARHWRSANEGLPAGAPGKLRTVYVIRPGLVAGGDLSGRPAWTAT